MRGGSHLTAGSALQIEIDIDPATVLDHAHRAGRGGARERSVRVGVDRVGLGAHLENLYPALLHLRGSQGGFGVSASVMGCSARA